MLLFSLLLACIYSAQPPEPNRCPTAESIPLLTPDGATIQLHHHPADGPPVLVVHGISSNHRSWDLSPERSLAVALTSAGYDAWLLDLRGHGDAIRSEGRTHGWTVDHYGGHDLARAITHVKTTTGAKKVALVGHSMGGMVAAAYHGIHGDDDLGALVVVGSPIVFDDPDLLLRLGQASLGMGALLQQFRSDIPAKWIATIPGPIPLHGEGILFNGRNVAPNIRTQMLKQIVSPVSREELKHFTKMMDVGRLTSADGETDYVQTLQTLQAPLLVISGAADKVAPPQRVMAWMEASGSSDETYIEAGKKAGMQEDYGHLDLTFGDRAQVEVHGRITSWLDDHFYSPPPPAP